MENIYKTGIKRILMIFIVFLSVKTVKAQNSVGIGTSSPDANAVLHLKGDGSQGIIIPSVTDTAGLSFGAAQNGMLVYSLGTNEFFYWDSSIGYWKTMGGGSSEWLRSGNFVFVNNDSVGIGTNTPKEKLEVVGRLRLTGNSRSILENSTDPNREFLQIRGKSSTLNSAGINLYGDADALYPNELRLYSGGSTRMMIVPEGTVGIGTTNPDTSALVDMDSQTKGLLIPRSDSATLTDDVGPNLTLADDGMMFYAADLNAFVYWDGELLDWRFLNENYTMGVDTDWQTDGAGHVYNMTDSIGIGTNLPITPLQIGNKFHLDNIFFNGQDIPYMSKNITFDVANTSFKHTENGDGTFMFLGQKDFGVYFFDSTGAGQSNNENGKFEFSSNSARFRFEGGYGQLQLEDSNANVSFQLPDPGFNYGYTLNLPTGLPTNNGDVLASNTSGDLYWTTPSAGGGQIGSIVAYGGSTVPLGFLLCDGSAVSRVLYADLFAEIGTAWGIGDGSTTFNLPDLRGRFARGVDGSAGNDPDKNGRTAFNGGNDKNNVGSYQNDQFASHDHIFNAANVDFNNVSTGAGPAFGATFGGGVSNTTGGNETRPKNAYVTYIIQYTGVSSTATLVDTDNQTLSIAGQNLSISGGNTITLPTGLTGSGAATRVAFWNSATSLTSNANLYWDNTNTRLGIGTSIPVAELDVSTKFDPRLMLSYGGNATVINTLLGSLSVRDQQSNVEQASISFMRDAASGGGADLPTSIEFRTTADATSSPTTKMTITNKGNVGIGTTAPSEKMHVVGSIVMDDGNQALGRVLTSDATGKGKWQDLPASSTTLYSGDGALAGARTVTMGTNTLSFESSLSSGNSINIENSVSGINGSPLRVASTGSRSIGNTAMTIENLVTKAGGSGTTKVGLTINSTGSWAPGTNQPNVGLQVTVSGADINNAATFMGGNVGIGTITPAVRLDVAGSTWDNIVQIGQSTSSNKLIFGSGVSYASISGSTTNRNDITIQHSTGNVAIGGAGSPSEKLDVEGSVQVDGEYTYETAKTLYMSVSPSALIPESSTYYRGIISGYGYVAGGTTGLIGELHCGLNLPDGATIKRIDFYIEDSDVTYDFSYLQLWEKDMTSTSAPFLSAPITAGTFGITAHGVNVNWVVDNSTKAYAIRIGMRQATTTHRIHGIKITYEVSKAD